MAMYHFNVTQVSRGKGQSNTPSACRRVRVQRQYKVS